MHREIRYDSKGQHTHATHQKPRLRDKIQTWRLERIEKRRQEKLENPPIWYEELKIEPEKMPSNTKVDGLNQKIHHSVGKRLLATLTEYIGTMGCIVLGYQQMFAEKQFWRGTAILLGALAISEISGHLRKIYTQVIESAKNELVKIANGEE